jgi:uncharacterized repeat protein (TIGR01451 family)/MYXO-CTERM domain-containing protein
MRFFGWRWGLVSVVLLGLEPPNALAAPALRLQIDQRGDFLLFGNTLGQDCAPGIPIPVVGTVGDCGSNINDTAPDVFWRSDAPGPGQAIADTSIASADARSTAVLQLPPGASVTYARLYWGAMLPAMTTTADDAITLERPGQFSQSIRADSSWVAAKPMEPNVVWYQSSADITAVVQMLGNGPYRVGDVLSIELRDLDSPDAFVAWAVVVFYDLGGAYPEHNLALFDGFDVVAMGNPVSATLQGFLVPDSGFDAKLGVIAYEGDNSITGDSLIFQGTALSDAQNPADNFFNSTRSTLGVPVSIAGDLPQLTGTPGSQSGLDLDVVDITSLLHPRDTSASMQATSMGDTYLLGAFVTSIATLKPDFGGSTKTAANVSGGAVRDGNIIEYTIRAENRGSDTSENTVLRDALPAGVTYVPGTIQVTAGPNIGPKTDPAGDDQGEYDAPTRTVIVRIGTGANATQGGRLAPGESTTVVFRVTINAGVTGRIVNQAVITASGVRGAPSANFPTDGDPVTPGAQPTVITVGGCNTNADCALPTPFCNQQSHNCVGCLTRSDCGGTTPICDPTTFTCGPCTADGPPSCPDPARPACQHSGILSGACTECSATNTTRCGGAKPQCLTDLGICGCSSSDGDSECGGSMSGIICSAPSAGICVPGCSVAPGRNNCPSTEQCSDLDGGVGVCVDRPCTRDNQCTTAPLTHCDVPIMTCVQCVVDRDCAEPFVCDDATHRCYECTPTKTGNCSADGNGSLCLANGTCGCTADNQCGGQFSGRVCDTASQKCTFGCRGTGGNRCPPTDICTSMTDAIGRCVPVGGGDGGTGVGDGGVVSADGGLPCAGSDGTPCGNNGLCLKGICQLQFTGGGCTCSAPGVPATGIGLLLLGIAALRRRRRRHG